MISIFDTHAHLDLPQFEPDRSALVRRLETGTFPGGLAPEGLNDQPIEIAGVLIPGIDAASCRKVHEIAALSDLFHIAVAIHPNHTAEVTKEDWQTITELARQNDVIAIGETGLDRYWDDVPIEVQIDWFHRHMELSQETGKPILIHCRDAWDDLLPILQQAGKLRGVIHAFSGTAEQMSACVELGFFISFAGSVTYRNAKFAPLWEAARKTPADRLLIETDAPFMIPHPLRGKLPHNEPTLAALTALRLAELRDGSLQTIAETTAQNARRLFKAKNDDRTDNKNSQFLCEDSSRKKVEKLKSRFPVLLSFGSNLGDRHETLNRAWHVLGRTDNIELVRLSPFYETEPVGGPVGQPKYINAAGVIQTVLSPMELLEILQKIEAGFGRVRAERWGARTLDIDILLYEDRIIESPILTIPHVEMLHRQFVLEPAKDLAADWVHPLTKKTIGQHWCEYKPDF